MSSEKEVCQKCWGRGWYQSLVLLTDADNESHVLETDSREKYCDCNIGVSLAKRETIN